MTVPFRIQIAASFTAEPIRLPLQFWGNQLGMNFDVGFAPFQQVLQTLLSPTAEFATNNHGANVVMVRALDLGERALENAAELADAMLTATSRDRCPLLFVLCPSEPPQPEIEDLLGSIDVLYPVDRKFDSTADRLGAIPYTLPYFAALATVIARKIAAVSLLPYKVIAVDCDNTLWKGICGEDGPAGVSLDEPRRALQEFLLRQREAGMLLTLASKNNLADVMETFAQHPEMPLRPEHFTALRVDWNSKPTNLAAMALELDLGIDSFIFIDDSARECAEMEEGQPQVLTLELPADAAQIPHFLNHVWAFDHPVVTEEDRKRAASYSQSKEFGRKFRSAHTLQDFMASLRLELLIRPADESNVGRIAQLTQRTNQFNFTTIRRTEAEVRRVLETHECLVVDVTDRFGAYGLAGVVILEAGSDALVIDTLLLSCRVLGRGVEHRLMAHIGKLAVARGLEWVEAPVHATGRNQPAMEFVESLGPGSRFSAASLQNLQWSPPAARLERATQVDSPHHRFVPFAKIARELSTVDRILDAMGNNAATFDPALTETERKLADIWSDLLKTSSLRATDRFFECGGHSLLAILLISRVQESFGVELPVDDVYSGDLTLHELAAKIDAMRSGAIPADEYEAMLAEISAMSDEEVRALLEQQ